MHPSFIPPRQVTIGAAASFVGVTPRTIRHYHAIGLLAEPVRGTDGRRRYGYDDVVRLSWVRKMAGAGIALDDIGRAFVDAGSSGADGDPDMADVLDRVEAELVARESELRRQREAVQRMRSRGSRLGLLDDFVARRLDDLPDGSVRQSDLDSLLVVERTLGPLGAAFHATRVIALARHPELREESDRLDADEEALDDSVAVDDPRVAHAAAERYAFERRLNTVIEGSGLDVDDALLDEWDALSAADGAARPADAGRTSISATDAVASLPYDLSPARLRCLEMVEEMLVQDIVPEGRG